MAVERKLGHSFDKLLRVTYWRVNLTATNTRKVYFGFTNRMIENFKKKKGPYDPYLGDLHKCVSQRARSKIQETILL